MQFYEIKNTLVNSLLVCTHKLIVTVCTFTTVVNLMMIKIVLNNIPPISLFLLLQKKGIGNGIYCCSNSKEVIKLVFLNQKKKLVFSFFYYLMTMWDH